MMRKLFFILFILLILTTIKSNAQYFQNLSVGNGLSQPSVMAIGQDTLGRMWFGTREGLNVYDGGKIKYYKGEVDNGKDGKLWIGNSISSIVSENLVDGNKVYFISDFFLYAYDVQTELFCKIDNRGKVTAMTAYKGNILYAQRNNIFLYDLKTHKKSIYKILPESTSVNVIEVDRDNMYVGTTDGIIISPFGALWEEQYLLPGEDIYRIYEDSKHNLWIGTRMNGLYRRVNDRIEKIPLCPNGINGIIDPQIREFVEDDDGNIWFGTFMGLQKYDIKNHTYAAVNIPQYAGGLNHPSIFSLFKDRQGNIWAGSYFGGVNYFNPTRNSVIHYDYQAKDLSSLYYSYIGEMIMDKRGNLWISTDGGGVSCIDRGWRTVEQFTATPLSRHGLPHNNVKSMCYDMDNDMLYIGTHLGGLSRYDIKKKTFYNYSTDYKSPVMPGRIIHHVKKWKNKIVVSSREGVFLLDTRSNRFTHLPDCFGEAMIFDIDKNGTFYTTSGNNIKAISLDTPNKQEIISLHALGEVSHILSVDKKLYICTLGSGMIVYDTSLKTINTYTSYNSNLPSNYCYSSRLTLNGKLILIGDRGITMFDTDKKTFASIKQDYLKAPIIYGCGICISKENIIYVGDTKGITRVEESDFLSPLQHKQPIYFSNINVNNAIIHPSEEGKILKKSLAFTDRIDLASSQNNIIIEFASSDYINRHVQQIFEYKLEGFDKTWISTTVPFARYTNLSPGNYTLCVRMADGDAQDMAVLNICISLPWYNTWYAWVLYIIIFITIVWMIIRYRKEKNDLFLSLEKERFEKQHIEELNHEKLVFFTNVSHEFRTPLTLIISHIESLLQMPNLQPMVYNRVLKLKRSAQYMNNLISELLDFRKFTQNKYTLNMSQKDICLFMKEIFYVFSDYAHSKGLKYEFFSNQEVILCWFDSKQLEKVFLNLLSNAFKYTERGSIEIKICVEGENVAISIHDTGKGIAMGDFNRIFDRFYQIEGSSESATSPGTGIGLALTKSIVEKHHGEICLDSQLGKGSVFTVKLPLGDARYIHDEHVHFADREKESDLKETDEDSRVGICAVANEESFQSEEGESKKYTVLVVEDNDELIQVLCELFSPFYQVIMASNGKEGLDKAYEYKPDLIISDIMMPEMSGTEMCLKIKNNIDLCHIPIILLTALNSVEQNIEGLNRGADDYISKPFNPRILLARANNLVRNRLLIHNQIRKNPITEVDLTSINLLDQEILKKTSEAIEAHMDDTEFDIPELCKEIGVGRSVLYSKFKALTGMTPNNFILNYRLKFAATMLQKYPDIPVSEVGDKCGFSSPIYFSRCFKNQYGVPPQNYRKSSRNNSMEKGV